MATTGTDNFGGASFTARLVDYFLGQRQTIEKEDSKSEAVKKKCSLKLLASTLWKECERAKIELEGSDSSSNQTR